MERAESRQSTVPDIGPPISASFTFFQGDGAPIDMIGHLKDADDSGEYDKIVVILGVFSFLHGSLQKDSR
jgi:hypothetical protein